MGLRSPGALPQPPNQLGKLTGPGKAHRPEHGVQEASDQLTGSPGGAPTRAGTQSKAGPAARRASSQVGTRTPHPSLSHPPNQLSELTGPGKAQGPPGPRRALTQHGTRPPCARSRPRTPAPDPALSAHPTSWAAEVPREPSPRPVRGEQGPAAPAKPPRPSSPTESVSRWSSRMASGWGRWMARGRSGWGKGLVGWGEEGLRGRSGSELVVGVGSGGWGGGRSR